MAQRMFVLASLALASLLSACGSERTADAALPPPIADCDDAFACALREKLAPGAPTLVDGIDNVFQLSPRIVSGAEPQGPEALGRLAEMGVKTILSVDGKTPDVETARALGMRYVHVPIRYTGVEPAELVRIVKTFRELKPPFFVHCFHGRHRGPAAAAIGRVVLDGASREKAIAEMRQWAGTAGKYQGLYQAVATGDLPTASETRAFDWAFDEAKPVTGLRSGMVRMTRSFDNVKLLHKRKFATDPDHPDLDAVNEATKVREMYIAMHGLDDPRTKRKDYDAWMVKSMQANDGLLLALQDMRANKEGAWERADRHFTVVKNLCTACHHVYRNNKY